jgi:hypothetical protein
VADSLHTNDLGESLSDAETATQNYVNDVSIGSFKVCHTSSISEYTALNGRIIGKHLKGHSHGLKKSTIMIFAWRN